MNAPPFELPDVLVLGGGGILGEAWMTAVLAGLEQAAGFDARSCEEFVGTSAGSIVAAALAAGVSPRSRLGRLPEQPSVPTSEVAGEPTVLGQALRLGRSAGAAAAGPLVPVALRAVAPGGALLRRAALSRVSPGRRSLSELGRAVERMGARWDGRLRISAVDVASGQRAMFGAPGAPSASVAQAVQASCAIPGVFRPIVVDGRSYVDGGVWSPTNMDAATARRGTRVLCLNPTGSLTPSPATPLAALGSLSRSLAAIEALALGRRGAVVSTVSPDRDSIAAIGGNLMDGRRRAEVTVAGLAQGRGIADAKRARGA